MPSPFLRSPPSFNETECDLAAEVRGWLGPINQLVGAHQRPRASGVEGITFDGYHESEWLEEYLSKRRLAGIALFGSAEEAI